MRERGFSLVEFMIAMTIGLFLIAGLVYILAETSRSRSELERSSRQIENGRYAIDRITEDLRHAGFYSEYYDLPMKGQTGFPVDTAAALPCGGAPGAITTATLEAGLPLGVQAYDGGSSVPTEVPCIAANDYQADTDILIVRRAGTTAFCPAWMTSCPAGIPGGTPAADQYYIQTSPQGYKLNTGNNTGSFFDLTRPAVNNTETRSIPLRPYVVRIYFVSRCNVPSSGNANDVCDGAADGGTPIPTLKMLELGPGPAFRKLAIAEGIEQLQFDFGIDNPACSPPPLLAKDGVADCVRMCDATESCTIEDWSNVVSVEINLVARNTEISPDYVDDKVYSLGRKGYSNKTNDRYRRHAYSTLVRVNNISMRRE